MTYAHRQSRFQIPSIDLVFLSTYHHAELNLLSAVLLLDGLVQDDVQEDVVAAQDADDLATAI